MEPSGDEVDGDTDADADADADARRKQEKRVSERVGAGPSRSSKLVFVPATVKAAAAAAVEQ